MNKMDIIKQIVKPILRPVVRPLRSTIHRFMVDHFLKHELEKKWLNFAGTPIDWNNPKTLNEKIQWLICFSDTSEWTRLADKILVREFIKQKGFEDILIPLIGTWNDARDIDFDSLPDKCVLKCNHDSGSVVIIDKAKGYDKESAIEKLNGKLKLKYGYASCEPHYNKIKPCVLCEEFVDFELGGKNFSSSPIDYKIFCYNGVPDSILVVYNRNIESVELETYDLDWNHRPEWEATHIYYRKGRGIVPRPDSLSQMLSAARVLSAGFPQVRVDFYDVKGKLYFGEMTFTSDSGVMPYLSDEYQLRAGKLIDLSLAKKK